MLEKVKNAWEKVKAKFGGYEVGSGWHHFKKELRCSKCEKTLKLENLEFESYMSPIEGYCLGYRFLATCPRCGEKKHVGFGPHTTGDREIALHLKESVGGKQ